MTIDEFIQKLQAVDFDWEISGHAIRAWKSGIHHCVVSAVLDDIHVFCNPFEALHKRLGLSTEDAKIIMDCADHILGYTSRFDSSVREKLLKACKLPTLKR